MAVIFKVENHLYESLDPNDKIIWTSATKFIEQFKQKFDPVAVSEKCAKNKKSKWYGLTPLEIRTIWDQESTRAIDMGTFYHDQREEDVVSLNTIDRMGRAVPVIKPIIQDDVKHAPIQRLTEGIYPEHFVYLKSASICGQADRVEVVQDHVDIIDYKTNKRIDKESYKDWQGVSKKMLGPLAHLDDCNFNHYALQLSLYLYIILKHNPRYKPGRLILQHVVFEKEGETKYGYPIYKKDNQGNFIVKNVVPYEVPYLKTEIRNMIKWHLEKK